MLCRNQLSEVPTITGVIASYILYIFHINLSIKTGLLLQKTSRTAASLIKDTMSLL